MRTAERGIDAAAYQPGRRTLETAIELRRQNVELLDDMRRGLDQARAGQAEMRARIDRIGDLLVQTKQAVRPAARTGQATAAPTPTADSADPADTPLAADPPPAFQAPHQAESPHQAQASHQAESSAIAPPRVAPVSGARRAASSPRQSVAQLQRRYASTGDPADRAALVELHQGLAQSIAYRFCQHKHDQEDRLQIALLGLLNAVDRFDPDRGVSFSTFAWATIVGELKRFHRNSGWAAHVPRSLQELHLRTSAAVEHLTIELGRSPTLLEIAALTGDDVEAVVEGVELNGARHAASLDSPAGEDGDSPRDIAVEAGFAHVDTKMHVAALLALLPARSREILRLRFVEDMSQSQIASRLGLSQMHISRLLTQALQTLRASGLADPAVLN